MSKDYTEQIKEYSKQIQTLKSFTESVRKMPGMYIGYLGNQGYLNMIREVFQNSIDELIKNDSPCDYIVVTYDDNTKWVTIEDNGRGIPFGRIIDVFSKEHTSSNYNKKLGEYSSGRHGVGAKVTNALSKEFVIQSYILGEGRQVSFLDGEVKSKGEVKIPNKNNRQGTTVSFVPSFEVMGEITTTYKEVFLLVESMFRLTPIGSKMRFTYITGKKSHSEDIVNEAGLVDYVIDITKSPLVKPICGGLDTGEMKAEFAFTFDTNVDKGKEVIISFANLCPTTDGEHVAGLVSGVSDFFRDYMNKLYLQNKGKITVESVDIKAGLRSSISVALLYPTFTGQAKEKLADKEIRPFVRKLVIDTLNQWVKANPSDLQRLCKFFKEMAEIRIKKSADTVKLIEKFEMNSITSMPAKYEKPNLKKVEIHIVEGDSAKGSGSQARDKRYQGIFPIRGKIPNAFTTARDKFLANPEIQAMLKIFGGGYGRNFDISKVEWEKIVIDTDADPDGAHIRSLLLKFFLMYCRPLVEAGRVYASVPPLYGIEIRGKMKYFTDQLEFIKYVQKEFSSKNEVATENGKPMTQSQIVTVLYKNSDFVYNFNKVANMFALNPYLLEIVLNNIDDFTKMKKAIKAAYRFVEVTKVNGTITIDGLIGENIQTMVINDVLLSHCKPIMHYLKDSPKFFMLNGNKTSLYGLMDAFSRATPNNVTRYKGLGEMNPDQLRDSTLSPDNRTLIRYTVEDIEREEAEMRALESNKDRLLNELRK